uniref:Uncharacterized protein n=1 Tax=Esox lucius TaxID=8010 RepID=A0AAY5K549_ESOLU
MNRIGVNFGLYSLCLLYLGFVSFWRNTVALICPEEGNLFNEKDEADFTMIHQFYFRGKGEYKCPNGSVFWLHKCAYIYFNVITSNWTLTNNINYWTLTNITNCSHSGVRAPAAPHLDYEVCPPSLYLSSCLSSQPLFPVI